MKQLLSLFLFLLPCLALAQYPSNGNQKITLGEQTTADGLIWRGVLADTGIITPLSDTSAYIILDTVNHRFYNYNRATNVWSVAGGGTSVTTFSGGTTGLTPSTATSGAVTLGGTLAVASGGTGITSLGTGVATFLGTPSSANLASAVTNETGSGNLVFATQPVFTNTIGVGGTGASTSGSGITFPATQSASTNVNTLDDYEEGTWTPTVVYNTVNTPTFSNQTGRYTKIGSIVQITFQLSFNENGSTGSYIVVGNLPFTVKNTGGAKAVVTIQSFGFTLLPLSISLTGKVDNNTTNIELQLNDNSGTFITDSNTDNDQDIYGFVTYEVN
jgi:hypothetical protein